MFLWKEASKSGQPYNSFMRMDMNEVDALITGNIELRELRVNDIQSLNHTLAIWISQTVWGSDHFPKVVEKIRLLQDPKTDAQTREEILESIYKFQEDVYGEIQKVTEEGGYIV